KNASSFARLSLSAGDVTAAFIPSLQPVSRPPLRHALRGLLVLARQRGVGVQVLVELFQVGVLAVDALLDSVSQFLDRRRARGGGAQAKADEEARQGDRVAIHRAGSPHGGGRTVVGMLYTRGHSPSGG